MPISKKKALELIDIKIKQFQYILDTATYDTRYNSKYYEAYHGTEDLVTELFSEEETEKFRDNVSIIPFVGIPIDYENVLRNYKKHINKCISQLNVYNEKIKNFWEDPEPVVSEANKTVNPKDKQKADILLVTATKTESKAILEIFPDITHQTSQFLFIDDRVYHDIGSVNRTRVFMVQSEMGSGGARGISTDCTEWNC